MAKIANTPMRSIQTTRQEKLCMFLRHARKKAGLTQEELSAGPNSRKILQLVYNKF